MENNWINQLPSEDDLVKMVKSYTNGQTRTLLIPVMINYAPVMLISRRNFFLCIVVSEKHVSLGFSTEITARGLVTQDIPYSSIGQYLAKNSISSFISNSVKGISQEKQIINTELITSLGIQTVGALSIVDNEFYEIKSVLEQGATENTEYDSVLRYCIEMQSRFDAFARQFTGRRMDDTFPKYAELRYISNIIPTNIDMTGKGSYLSEVRKHGTVNDKVSLDGVSMCLEDKYDVKVMLPSFENIDLLPNNMIRHGDYFITALGYLRDDFGPGSISGLSTYISTANTYLLALLCNDKMFRGNYKSMANVVYNNKYRIVDVPEVGPVLEPAQNGNVQFTSFISGAVFNTRKDRY